MPQDLGLEESNKGVFDGSWKGSGEVIYHQQYVTFTTRHPLPKSSKGYSGLKVQLTEWKHLQMKTLQGYLVLSKGNNLWIVKDSLNYCIFAYNVLLYYVAMQPWLWGPGPLHLLPPGRQPDKPLHHCTHYKLFDEYFPFPLTIRACTSFHMHAQNVNCFHIKTIMSNQGHKTLRRCKGRTHSFHISIIISYIFWKSKFSHFNDSFIKIENL